MPVQVVGDVSEKIGSSFGWRIPNWKSWLSKEGDIAQSPPFQFLDATWKLEIYYSINRKKIFLTMIRDTWEQNTQIVAIRLSARRSDETEYKISEGKFKFIEDDNEHTLCLTEKDLVINKIASDGCLTIYCVLYMNRSNVNTGTQSTSSKGVDKLSTDFKNLLITAEDSDVSIKVKDREFRVHKIILRARSPVLYSMLKHGMAEKSSGIVEIVDCDPEAFQKFLWYLYTGHVGDLSNDVVLNLYCVADKYDVEEVKAKCVQFMTNNLSVETFCDIVALALKHDESGLLETATEFFGKNIKEIIVTMQWQSFLKENTAAANALHIKALDYYSIHK